MVIRWLLAEFQNHARMFTAHPYAREPMTLTAYRLARHQQEHPDHVLVGRYGEVSACGTCLGLPNPENGLPK